jgi:hypothetical protein
MAKRIMIDEFHLTVTAPAGLQSAEYRTIRRTLTSARFQKRLRSMMREILRHHPSLRNARITVGQ